jgi:hypothetical protein
LNPSDINTVVIKSGQKLSTPPRVGQRVRIENDSLTYTVLRVDAEKKVADLVCTTGHHTIRESVSFDSLRSVPKSLADALEQFLRSA